MSYQLTEENIPEYLGTSQVLRAVFGDSGNLQVQNLAEGNINLIFRAFSRDDPIGRSVILKQALPHAHKYPDFKVPQERSKLEWEMLELENRYCPGLAPRVHHFDEGMYTIIMEDLNRHIIMRRGLMRQQVYPQFAGHIGIFLARTLFYTSDFFLDSAEKKSLVARFINPVMCRVTEDLVFTQPYISHSNNHWTPQLTEKVHRLQRDEQLRAEALLLKEQFMTRAQALIHGDLHTGSIMVNQTDTKVIDPEFGFFGPMGFDIGAVIGNLVLSYASQEYHAQEEKSRLKYRAWLTGTIVEIWSVFAREFKVLWTGRRNDQWQADSLVDRYLDELLQDSIGFAAAKMIRRIVGLAHVPDMWEIPNDEDRAVAEGLALDIAVDLMGNRRHCKRIEDVVEIVVAAGRPRNRKRG